MQTFEQIGEQTNEQAKSLISTSLSKAFELILNQALKLDETQGKALEAVDEKVIQLTFSDLKQTFFVIYRQPTQANAPGEVTVQTHLMGQADSHLTTTTLNWVQHKTEAKPDDAIGTAFLNAIHNIEIDWEEGLSNIIGDPLTFQVGSLVRNLQKNGQAAKQKIGDTLEEYLHFEANLLPTQSQVNRFNQKVADTAKAVDALATRIHTLK